MFLRITTFLFLILMLPSSADAVLRSLCEGYKIDSSEIIRFNVNEKKLICGDHNAESWNKIPRSGLVFCAQLLQGAGIWIRSLKRKVKCNNSRRGKTRITDVSIKGSPRTLRAAKGIRGAPLDPKPWTARKVGVSGLKSKGLHALAFRL